MTKQAEKTGETYRCQNCGAVREFEIPGLPGIACAECKVKHWVQVIKEG